jgi:hypothetical protein
MARIESKLQDLNQLQGQGQEELQLQGQGQVALGVQVLTPRVEQRLRAGGEELKELRARVVWGYGHFVFVFQVTWPLLYPDSAPLRVLVLEGEEEGEEGSAGSGSGTGSGGASLDLSEVNTALEIFAEACVGSHTGCAKDILTYAMELLSDLTASASASTADAGSRISLHVLKYNHLLLGSEHKKEKAMVSIAKKSLLGGVCYGTPGLVVLLGADEETTTGYLGDCRSAGKRGEVAFQGSVSISTITEGSEARWSATDVAASRGFVELTTQEVQACMGGLEAFKQYVLQIC